jgi:hypothetical protein
MLPPDDEEKGLLKEVAGNIAFDLHDMEMEEEAIETSEGIMRISTSKGVSLPIRCTSYVKDFAMNIAGYFAPVKYLLPRRIPIF